MVDGTFGKRRKKYYNSFEQIDYLTKIYPFDKNILNFVCLGDHDYSLKKISNIYPCGEILDIDGLCGGYNIAFAFASGYFIGKQIIKK